VDEAFGPHAKQAGSQQHHDYDAGPGGVPHRGRLDPNRPPIQSLQPPQSVDYAPQLVNAFPQLGVKANSVTRGGAAGFQSLLDLRI